jgi:RNA polymerase sigma-70 factor, ECF subfamily
MARTDWLAERFEENRPHLRAVAYRMLGSVSEAEDAVQEGWLRFSRADTSGVENVGGWLTTVVARVCLDMLRSRGSRREDPLTAPGPDSMAIPDQGADPEQEVLLADSVGLALIVVLETLAPDERLAFVLHDMFAVPFDEIAPIVGRSPAAARQLASRARRRVRGAAPASRADLGRQREIVEAFLAAARAGDFEALLKVLDPDVVRRLHGAGPPGVPSELRGAQAVGRGALAGTARTRSEPVAVALVNGAVGIVTARQGRLTRAITFRFRRGRIAEMDVILDPARLRQLDLGVLEG